jgi:protein-S-isoprenylcysteine O-methyltransferase Ste14
MNTVRYVLAVMTLVSMPPAIVLWYAIHPVAAFWRRLGFAWTYTILGVPAVALMVWLFFVRDSLLGADFGTNWLTFGIGVVAFAGSLTMGWKRKKLLTYGVLAGMPELSAKRYPGRVLQEGPYAVIRHPRYVEVLLGTLGYALIVNYLGIYVLWVLCFPAIYLVVLLEERELRERFGTEYEEYAKRVPRFVPRRKDGETQGR